MSTKLTRTIVTVVLSVVTVVGLSGGSFIAPVAQAATAAEIQAQIDLLLQQIKALQTQLGGGSTGSVLCTFTGSLTIGSTGAAVMCLQKYLNAAGFQVAATGAGSPGNETEYFGSRTQAAVAAWQKANGVSPAAGYFGPISQAKYSAIAGSVTPPTPPGTPTPTPIGSGLTVSMGATQPAATLAPASAARVPFTKVTFTASADGDVTVSSVTARRTGPGSDTGLTEILLLDEDGAQVGLAKTLNSNHEAILNEPFKVKAGTSRTMTLAGNRAASSVSVSGELVSLSLMAVNAGTSAVNGSFPIVGNQMTMNTSLTIGTVTVQTGTKKSVATTTENIGITGFTGTSIRVTAGSQEDVRIWSIRWNQTGTIGQGDIANVKTYVNDTAYDTMVSSDGKYYTAKFGSGVVVKKGDSAEIYIKYDIVGGTSRTIKFDIYRTTDLAITGETYGFGITPPTSGTGFTSSNPWYFGSSVTVGNGKINVENSTSVPAQNIAVNLSNQPLGGVSVDVKGEAISVGSMVFSIATTSTGQGLITGIAMYDPSGKIVAGPVDATGAGTSITFSDTVTFPVGKNVYTIKGKIPSTMTSDGTIQFSTTPSTGWTTVRGSVTGDSLNATPSSSVSFAIMTVKAGALTISVSANPPAQTVVSGASQFTFANYVLDATASGEDVRLSTLPLEFNAASGATNLTSCQLYDGSTVVNANNVVNPTAAASSTNFTLDGSGLTITKGTVKTLALKCNIASGATGTYAWGYDSTASDLTPVGLTSGQSITEVENDSAGQLMTLTANGTLAVALDTGSTPAYRVVAANTTDNTVTALRFTTTAEPIRLQKVALQLSSTASNSANDITRVTLWDGATFLGEALFTANSDLATSTLTTPLVINKDDTKVVTLKVDTAAQGNSQIGTPGTFLLVDWDNDATIGTQGVGVNSGVTINRTSSADSATNGFRVVRSYPTYADISLSDTKLVAGRRDLKKFSIKANGTGDIGIEGITFRIATSSVTAQTDMIANTNVYVYQDSGYSSIASGIQSDGAMAQGSLGASRWASASTDLKIGAATSANASTTVVIPAGETRYFVIRGDVTVAGATYSASTQVQGDAKFVADMTNTAANSSYLATTTYIETTGDNDFIWRPFSTTTTQSSAANDYLNGYGVPGLPNTNSNAQILTQ